MDITRDTLRLRPSPYLGLLFPEATPEDAKNTDDSNARVLQSLLSCLATATCTENQTKIVLLADSHFALSVRGSVSGEDIWAASVLGALKHLGYSSLYSDNLQSASFYYRMFPDLVKVVFGECEDITNCFGNELCVKSASNLLGIPIWKMFSLHFWNGACHPLGGSWTLSPEDYRGVTRFLGYSLETECMTREVVPPDNRSDQVYVLAKWFRYFFADSYPWPHDALARAVEQTGLQFITGYTNDTETSPLWSPPVVNYGQMPKELFHERLSHSRALLGIGQPYLSPSPYDALCFGVPFINPIDKWDNDDRENRAKWSTQHDGLRFIEEPYVYHVHKRDVDGLVRALRGAKDNPIDRYIPPAMTEASLLDRVVSLLEHDWRSEAQALLNSAVEFLPK
ncbi:hypothetical protein DACRYDRAFT_81852 [Dacryopinax primogenitus]|uniref:Glycosyltransferase family 18 catalytic domain-containing protein n=1 Tax=Dacryopinax primogenitus (strain DJM 731) TaxID=1858805 RepID=M5G6T3_DACPD|nr:uncharacterized protein DACRYDRAFT_81852 [Dacryopinax primogenitus]EJT99467.1 hypothetical protein DACRYDRAFT_81852 [Dacryopinax primogenitus]